MVRKNCPNKKENEKDCPCPELNCSNHGICCLCIRYHKNSKAHPEPACLRH